MNKIITFFKGMNIFTKVVVLPWILALLVTVGMYYATNKMLVITNLALIFVVVLFISTAGLFTLSVNIEQKRAEDHERQYPRV